MRKSALRSLLHTLASLRLTAIVMLLLALAIFSVYLLSASYLWLIPFLVLLQLNLLAALAVNRRINQSRPLWVFHLGLLAMSLLAQGMVLTSFRGHIEIADGQRFSFENVVVESMGVLHGLERLREIEFIQGGVAVDYAPRLVRQKTESTIWTKGEQAANEQRVGDLRRFHSNGYRFTTTANKGFAVEMVWQPKAGEPRRGNVHFPSYPRRDWQQRQSWVLPNGREVELELLGLPMPDTQSTWHLRAPAEEVALQLESNSGIQVLRPGEQVSLDTGSLKFERVVMWIGYSIDADPLLPAFVLTGFASLISLALYFHTKFRTIDVPLVKLGPEIVGH